MAGREADGAIINWLAPSDVPQVAAVAAATARAARNASSWPGSSCARATTPMSCGPGARRAIAAYMNVPVYAAFQEWLGRGEQLAGMWSAWKAGDRKQALAEIPDSVVDDLVVHGTPARCRARIAAVLRPRRDDELVGDPAVRPRPRPVGRRHGRWRRTPVDPLGR